MEDDPDMVARLMDEGAVPVSRLLDALPAEKGTRRSSTLVRWIRCGKNGVRLEGFRGAGSGWYTSKAALARFLARLTGRTPAPQVPTRTNREAQVAAAMAAIEVALGKKKRRDD